MLTPRHRAVLALSLAGAAAAALFAARTPSALVAQEPAGGEPLAGGRAGGAAAGLPLPTDADARRKLRRTAAVDAVEHAAPAVVSIGTTQIVPTRYFDWDFLQTRQGNQEVKGLGSGVIVHSSGLVITNAHVINQANQVVVRLTGLDKDAPEIPATILAADLVHDLAILRLDKPGPYPTATIGRGDDLMPGETILAIGSPFGFGRSVTTGVVSATQRSIDVRERRFGGLIQTDAAVNQGNSGGALLNILGEWVGVNSAIYSLSGGADGISFAIPMETVNEFLSHSLQTGRLYGKWLGMELADDATGSVRIATVYPDGPAARAGLPVGATVVEIDGKKLAPGAGLGAATLAIIDAGLSGGSQSGELRIGVVPAEGASVRPASGEGAARAVRPFTLVFQSPPTVRMAWDRLGLKGTEVTPQVREKTKLPTGSGILITEVREGGPAARVGLQPGDLLVGLGEQPLSAEEDLLDFMHATAKDSVAKVTLVRMERSRFQTRVERYTAKLTVE